MKIKSKFDIIFKDTGIPENEYECFYVEEEGILELTFDSDQNYYTLSENIETGELSFKIDSEGGWQMLKEVKFTDSDRLHYYSMKLNELLKICAKLYDVTFDMMDEKTINRNINLEKIL